MGEPRYLFNKLNLKGESDHQRSLRSPTHITVVGPCAITEPPATNIEGEPRDNQ